MWTQNERARRDEYALAEADNIPLHFDRPSRWQRFKTWVRDHPAKSALISVLIVGVLIAVIVGPVIGVRNAKSHDDAPAPESADYEVSFKLNASDDSGAPLTCDSLASSSPDAASQRASLASSIAAVLQLPQQQVDVSSVRCQRPAGQDAAGGRRSLLQSHVPLVLVAVFRLTGGGSTPGSGNSTSPSGSNNGGLPAAADVQAALEAGAARDMLLEALGKALGIPASSITLVGVVATPLGGPPPVPAPSPPAPSPAPYGIYYGGAQPPPGAAGVYGSPSPPAYGGLGYAYPPSPSYGG
ncbi:hypothetical protein HYH03_014949 [Edaphochlamys debaryana]|uniref:Uncharacterized protein n=1 Tax=Edaphochlamys debaryana TaxID=47281 RepID=A0A836BT08_9CHLO|nr:hypothetical protein HYH03_014949 [Edaphochlamys debaryana]|eukprot:KAG2486369.1 hypothetical protein HYH03_014949 [Edaphochlamys debaryana]